MPFIINGRELEKRRITIQIVKGLFAQHLSAPGGISLPQGCYNYLKR